jgi:hypothetical protein
MHQRSKLHFRNFYLVLLVAMSFWLFENFRCALLPFSYSWCFDLRYFFILSCDNGTLLPYGEAYGIHMLNKMTLHNACQVASYY